MRRLTQTGLAAAVGAALGYLGARLYPAADGAAAATVVSAEVAPLTALAFAILAGAAGRATGRMPPTGTPQAHAALYTDALTGLPNRVRLEKTLATALHGLRADTPKPPALLVIGLDRFKALNDEFGQAFGNQVLISVAHRLAAVAGPGSLVARLGSDVFAWLCCPAAASTAELDAQRALRALRAPLLIEQHRVDLTASVGLAGSSAGMTADRIMGAADTAMVEAKRLGGDRLLVFSDDMERRNREALQLRHELEHAMEAGSLRLDYQLKLRTTTRAVTGAEALLRWPHAHRGMVSPAVFVPVAERFGLMPRLGRWVIDEACRQVADWRAQGLLLPVAVNLSLHQLRQPGLVDDIAAALQTHGIPPGMLSFEITESTAMTDVDMTIKLFGALCAMGTQLAIDDFGTGYSSLAYLQRLPLRQLKIDRSFVAGLCDTPEARAIVQAVVQMAHALDMTVVAEGVETLEQLAALQDLRCDEVQGYLLARPQLPQTLLDWHRGAAGAPHVTFTTQASCEAPRSHALAGGHHG